MSTATCNTSTTYLRPFACSPALPLPYLSVPLRRNIGVDLYKFDLLHAVYDVGNKLVSFLDHLVSTTVVDTVVSKWSPLIHFSPFPIQRLEIIKKFINKDT